MSGSGRTSPGASGHPALAPAPPQLSLLSGGQSRLDTGRPGIGCVAPEKAHVGQSGPRDAGPLPGPARSRESPGPPAPARPMRPIT